MTEMHEAAARGDRVSQRMRTLTARTISSPCSRRGATSISQMRDMVRGFLGPIMCNVRTPLHLAAAGGHLDCVRVLIQYGADVSMVMAGSAHARAHINFQEE